MIKNSSLTCIDLRVLTCSRGMSLVSGSKKYTNKPASRCHMPKKRNTPVSKANLGQAAVMHIQYQ